LETLTLLKVTYGPLVALLLTSGLIMWLSPLARSAGLVDKPDARKKHKGEIPLIGGPAIFVAVFAAMVISGIGLSKSAEWTNFGAFCLAGMLLILAGTVDDYLDLTPTQKLVCQTLAALVMVFGAKIVLLDLGALGVDNELLVLGLLAVPVTLLATVGVVNAINMTDGLDGLAGSLVLVNLLGLMVATVLFGQGEGLGLLAILGAAIFGFLAFNYRMPWRPTAVVFLGDSGSMFLGFTVAWFAIKFTQGDSKVLAPAAALWFLILPLFDTVTLTVRRILKRRPPFGADREHLHHIFLLAGFTVSETVAIMVAISILGVGVGLAGTYFQLPDYALLTSFLVAGGLYFWMIMHSWSVMRFLRYSINRRTGGMDRREFPDRRSHWNVSHLGPERRSGIERRRDMRRSEDMQTIDESDGNSERKIAS
jgi:UDP-GlcNAc:undecaprenyl-phosphate GlcNAc-1-phosphate transferase